MKSSKCLVLMSGVLVAGAVLAATEPVAWPARALAKIGTVLENAVPGDRILAPERHDDDRAS